jgi:hypothetical protein
MTKPRGFEQRPFDFSREIVITGIAYNAAWKNVLDIPERFGNNVLYALAFGRVRFAEDTAHGSAQKLADGEYCL